jgi:hypothetical protein
MQARDTHHYAAASVLAWQLHPQFSVPISLRLQLEAHNYCTIYCSYLVGQPI